MCCTQIAIWLRRIRHAECREKESKKLLPQICDFAATLACYQLLSTVCQGLDEKI